MPVYELVRVLIEPMSVCGWWVVYLRFYVSHGSRDIVCESPLRVLIETAIASRKGSTATVAPRVASRGLHTWGEKSM